MNEARTESPLLIVFTDLSRFYLQSKRFTDTQMADTLDAYYELVGEAVRTAGGRTVKFIGDGSLAVYPESAVDAAVKMLLGLKQSVDVLLVNGGWECRFRAKVHFGTAIAGSFGETDGKRYDVIGKAVNTRAVLDSTGVALSVAAFRKLGPELRKRFKRHTPPVTYIGSEDPRPSRRNSLRLDRS